MALLHMRSVAGRFGRVRFSLDKVDRTSCQTTAPRLLSTATRSRVFGESLGQKQIFQSISWYSTRSHRPIQREKPKDLYAILGVSPAATQEQLKEAYYKLSMLYHPDRNQGSSEAHQKFTSLTEAYSILGQYEQRKKYDKGLLHHYPTRHHATKQTSSPSHSKRTDFVDRDKVKFNFDEFYKAHYASALKMQRDNKRKDDEAKVKASYYSIAESTEQLMIVVVSLAVFGLGLFFIPMKDTKVIKMNTDYTKL